MLSRIGRRRWMAGQVMPAFALLLGLGIVPVVGLAVDGGLVLAAHAELDGVATAAAEGGAGALDVRELQATGRIQLCTRPADPTGCGNGIGSADLVLEQIVAAAGLGSCRPLLGSPPGNLWESGPGPVAPAAVGRGCAYTYLSGCAAGLGAGATPTYAPTAPAELRVYLWRPVSLNLLALVGITTVEVSAAGTARLAHGFATDVASGSLPATPVRCG